MSHTPRPMRRKDRQIPEAEARALLEKAEYGVLASASAEGLPYATPLSYVFLEGKIYFHCARTGQKVENISAMPDVCFCVVGATQPVYDGSFSTFYESALAFGRACLVENTQEKTAALRALCEKYLPEHMDKADDDIAQSFARTALWCINVEYVSGKAKR